MLDNLLVLPITKKTTFIGIVELYFPRAWSLGGRLLLRIRESLWRRLFVRGGTFGTTQTLEQEALQPHAETDR
jgi:hypothetical protein